MYPYPFWLKACLDRKGTAPPSRPRRDVGRGAALAARRKGCATPPSPPLFRDPSSARAAREAREDPSRPGASTDETCAELIALAELSVNEFVTDEPFAGGVINSEPFAGIIADEFITSELIADRPTTFAAYRRAHLRREAS